MKKRSGFSRHHGKSPRNLLSDSAHRPRRTRKTWTFEHLESRHYFSATPFDASQWQSLSSNTPEGAAQILARELWWAALQHASTAAMNGNLSGGASAGIDLQYALRALPTDPLFANQWHLYNIGQQVGNPDFQEIFAVPGVDINVIPVWDMGYTGQGVTVAVIDSGVVLNHPDLSANVSPTLRFDALTGDNNPSPEPVNGPATAHGTAVAGLVAAAHNGVGGVGVAPGATIVPIRLIDVGFNPQSIIDAFNYATFNGIDITNNSWGPPDVRVAAAPTLEEVAALRDSVRFGRDGLGVIHMWASGNGAGPAFVAPWQSPGSYDNSVFDGYVSSRYTIGVSGIDHDGMYSNVDGTITAYPESGPSVFVAAPTASFASINIVDDWGIGSGIYTTDALGADGFNIPTLPNGSELDRDFLEDADYTSRFNGTSASAPIATGVIALMLEANPNLNYRDVQEILVRSAQMAAKYEIPHTGAIVGPTNTTWQVNPFPLFVDPDAWAPGNSALQNDAAQMNPAIKDFQSFQAPAFATGAGYTVSDGFGVYGDRYGYGHGVIDAELAVKLAEQWHDKDQNLAEELTFTTFYIPPGLVGNIPAAETAVNGMLVPGGVNGTAGFADFFDEYYLADPPDPLIGPFQGANSPTNTRGTGFLEFSVPADNEMKIEWVEVKSAIGGDLSGLRLTLVSPDGTVSELNAFDIGGGGGPQGAGPWANTGAGNAYAGLGAWTFTTNRSWGARSDADIIYNPFTGDPIGSRSWRLYVENYGGDNANLGALEIAWHGTRIDPNSKRIQGFVGIDENQNGMFNYSGVLQRIAPGANPAAYRPADLITTRDLTQERFAPNVTLQAKRVSDGQVVAQFVTGADGNYYFDLVPDDYVISITEIDGVPINQLNGTTLLNDQITPAGYLRAFKSEWQIDQDWFFAWEHQTVGNPNVQLRNLVPVDANGDPDLFTQPVTGNIPANVKDINFLLDIGPSDLSVNGLVFADLGGDGQFNGDDAPAPGFIVYADTNNSGQFELSDAHDTTDAAGRYQLDMPIDVSTQVRVSVLPPDANWVATNPASGSVLVVGTPGDTFSDANFAFRPPGSNSSNGNGLGGSIVGVVFSDRFDPVGRGAPANEPGVSGVRVFADDGDGVWEAGEKFTFTQGNGAFFLGDVGPGTVRVAIEVPTNYVITTPASGARDVTLLSDGVATNVLFGIRNEAVNDWGDLAGYPTTLNQNGPRHFIVPGFQLGAKIDGELNGLPNADATGDDLVMGDEDGVFIVGNGNKLQPGTNTLRITVSGVGGYLNAWIDWNNDGDWNDAGEQVFDDLHLNEGPNGTSASHNLTVSAPGNMAGGPLAARFRWGSAGNSFVGADIVGEVEDYRLANSLPAAVVVLPPGDFDGSGVVDQADYTLWTATFGSQTDLRADGNGNGKVDASDYTIWRNNKGAVASAAGSSLASGAGFGAGSAGGGSLADAEAAWGAQYARAMAALELQQAEIAPTQEMSPEQAAFVRKVRGETRTITVNGSTRTFQYFFTDEELAAMAAGPSATVAASTVATSTTTSSSPQTPQAPFSLAGLQFATEVSPLASSAMLSPLVASSSLQDTASLQLLDDVWSTGASDDDADESLLGSSGGDDDDDMTDLALAALFDDGLGGAGL